MLGRYLPITLWGQARGNPSRHHLAPPAMLNINDYNPAEKAVLRRSAARYQGTALPKSVGARLRYCLASMTILRKKTGEVAGFGHEGFVVTPSGWGHYCWGEEAQRQAHINA